MLRMISSVSSRSLLSRRRAGEPATQPLPPATPPSGSVWNIERWIARRMLQTLGNPPIAIVLWNGEVFCGNGEPKCRLVIHDRRAFWQLVRNRSLGFGDALADGRIEVEGGLLEFLEIVYRAEETLPQPSPGRFRPGRGPRANSLRRSRSNIHHHYDIGDDFYRLWLDREMLYTCAYFPSPETTLEAAQLAKMELVCRKVWLRPGETVVEAGCGWGSLALYMARNYGVTVTAYNISHEQIAHARRRAKAEGLDGRVEFIEDDYRTIRGQFDAFVSIGMLEHVGLDHYRDLGEVIHRCLRPEGRGILHSIGRDYSCLLNDWIEKRIFPGAYAPALREMLAVLEPRWFSVLDVENLRLHYAETLRHWLGRFEASADEVRRMFDDRFVRTWRLYLAGSMAAFLAGSLQIFQVVFTRHAVNDIPRTRKRLAGTGE